MICTNIRKNRSRQQAMQDDWQSHHLLAAHVVNFVSELCIVSLHLIELLVRDHVPSLHIKMWIVTTRPI